MPGAQPAAKTPAKKRTRPAVRHSHLNYDDWALLLTVVGRCGSEDQLLAELAWAARTIVGADGCDLLLRSAPNHLTLRASTIAPEYVGRMRIGTNVGIAGKTFRDGVRVVIRKNLSVHPNYVNYSGYDESRYQSAIFEPMRERDKVQGVLAFRKGGPWSPTQAELARVEELSSALGQLVLAFRNAHQAGTKVSRLGALSQVTSILASSPYLEEILQLLVNMTAQQFGYKVCTVRLLDEQNHELVLRATQATMKAYQRKRAIRLGESIAGRVIVERRTITVADVQTEEEYIGHDLAVEQGLRSMICVPLTIQDRAVGVLTCYTDEQREFEPDEIKTLETIAKQAAVSIEHAKLQVRHTLMQEMHHRVKNNLQQVVSLLRLQLRHSHYKSIEEAINDSLGRILAIASVHDLLSREDLDHVGVRSIAEALVQHQLQAFVLPGKSIQFDVRGENVRLNMTQATQVALVLNELIQNAVEHGFGIANAGSVHINVESTDDEVRIWVSNDGDKLPTDFDLTVASHLGLQIVANLCRALGGTYTIENRLGWAVSEVRFSRSASE